MTSGPEARRIRILYVIQEMNRGGAERILLSTARGAGSHGHEVALAARPGPLSPEFPGPAFGLPLLARRPWRVPAATVALERAIRAWRPELIHACNPGMAVLTALATLRGRRLPAVVSVQGVARSDYRPTARILRLAGLPVIACGGQVERALVAAGAMVRATVDNAVGPPPPARERAEVLREFGVPEPAHLIVSVGRLVPQKNHELAVRALVDIPEATLVILGEGPGRASIDAVARRAGVAGRVRLAGARADARAVMGAADVVVAPSRWEGLPLAVIEALAAGRPVVATRVIGLAELIEDGRSGLLVEDDDAPALAAAVRGVLADPVRAAHLGEEGRRTAARYSEEAMIDAYLSVYDGVVDGRR